MNILLKQNKFWLFLIFIVFNNNTFAQFNAPFSPKKGVVLSFKYTHHRPQNDLKKRFGSFSSVGIDLGYKLFNNLEFFAGINPAFGSRVKEVGMLDSMIGSSKDLIDANGNLALIKLYMRGTNMNVGLSYVIPVNANKNSGIWIGFAVGYFSHKIKFQYAENILPQLDNGMYKGYDRYSAGRTFTQTIGYRYFSPKNYLNFFAGVEFMQAKTTNLRGYNYDTRTFDNAVRADRWIAFKGGILLPIFSKKSKGKEKDKEEFYN